MSGLSAAVFSAKSDSFISRNGPTRDGFEKLASRIFELEKARTALELKVAELEIVRGTSRISIITKIINIVAEYYGLNHSDFVSDVRSREIIIPRHVAMYLCRTMTDKSFPNIGKSFKRDHTSVIHGYRKIKRL